jgi:hypothetical protein
VTLNFIRAPLARNLSVNNRKTISDFLRIKGIEIGDVVHGIESKTTQRKIG